MKSENNLDYSRQNLNVQDSLRDAEPLKILIFQKF